MKLSTSTMNHLDQLESESIHMLREVASEFENPVLLYSVGKDSSTLIRLCQKAFYPEKIPFPCMHIETHIAVNRVMAKVTEFSQGSSQVNG